MTCSVRPSVQAAPARAGVVVASTRASAGEYEDRTGPLITAFLAERGFSTYPPAVVPDGDQVRAAISAFLARGAIVVLTTGGTGVTPTDRTPEATAPLLDREIPGIPEAIRARGAAIGVPAAMLSRGLAGIAGHCLVVNLPGSPRGVRDALDVLGPILDHTLQQVTGSGDHDPASQG